MWYYHKRLNTILLNNFKSEFHFTPQPPNLKPTPIPRSPFSIPTNHPLPNYFPLLLIVPLVLNRHSTMMLFQKPPIFPLNPPSAHRRHPSAPPAVIVQPTRTPGLLSLTKPQRPSPHRHNHQPQQTNQQHRHSRTPKSKPVSRPDSLDSLNPPLAITEKKSSTLPHATPDKNARGRQQVKPAKDLTTRR
jgi:hypothetical protein